MDSEIQTKFEWMGARVKLTVLPRPTPRRDRRPAWWTTNAMSRPVSIDIRRDDAGEYFDLRHRSDVDVQVLDDGPWSRSSSGRAPGFDPGGSWFDPTRLNLDN